MNRDIIVAFGRKYAVTRSLYGEMEHWQTVRYADLAAYLNNANRIFGYRTEFHLAALAEYGFRATRHSAIIYDYHRLTGGTSLAQLLYANNIAYTSLKTAADTAATVAALTGAVLANGVIYTSLEEYLLLPARADLCLT